MSIYITKFDSISTLIGLSVDDLKAGKMSKELAEPIYESLMDIKSMRRMSKILKMGMYSAHSCLQDVEPSLLDGIISATGLGSTADTAAFLTNMIQRDEHLLTPTYFIQSTHNTLAGTLGIQLQNNCYNMTWSQRFLSFYLALEDAFLKIRSGQGHHLLLVAADELPDLVNDIIQKLNCPQLERHWDEAALSILLSSSQNPNSQNIEVLSINLKSRKEFASTENLNGNHFIVNSNEFLSSSNVQMDVDLTLCKGHNFINDGLGLVTACHLLLNDSVDGKDVICLGGDNDFVSIIHLRY